MKSIHWNEKEKEVISKVSIDRMWDHLAFIAKEDRLSGSEGEMTAVRYFKEVMESFGLSVQLLEIENLISLPVSAELKVLSPEERELPCITHSYSTSTPASGLECELIPGAQIRAQEARGKIVLNDGLAAPVPCLHWEEKGAAGQVWINSGDLPHNMAITTVWGHPVPETAKYTPKCAVVSMNETSGSYLKDLCAKGPVTVRLKTEISTDFIKVPLAIADLNGRTEPERFVLFNGHVDSWHKGAADNGAGNACMLETARILSKYRDNLRRGVRFAWWSGHSNGRYSGSNWYADFHWEDLYLNGVVNLNVDMIGCQGATDYSQVECSAELYDLGRNVIEQYAGQSPAYSRIPRSGDQSFWGIGLPSLYQLLSRQSPELQSSDGFVPGLPWFWHTEADIIDYVDRDVFLKDSQIYMATLWRLCAAPVLPFTFAPVADELISHLSELQKRAKEAFDLSPALKRAEAFRERSHTLKQLCDEIASDHGSAGNSSLHKRLAKKEEFLNQCIIMLSRILMPVNYSAVDRFDADRAIPIPALPRLQELRGISEMVRSNAPFKFLERKMVRERNRICHALSEASNAIEQTIKHLSAL